VSTGVSRMASHVPPGLSPELVRLLRASWIRYQRLMLLAITLVGLLPSHHFRRALYRHVFGVSLGRCSIIHWQARFFEPGGVQVGTIATLATMHSSTDAAALPLGTMWRPAPTS
jgi:hypothetical protein